MHCRLPLLASLSLSVAACAPSAGEDAPAGQAPDAASAADTGSHDAGDTAVVPDGGDPADGQPPPPDAVPADAATPDTVAVAGDTADAGDDATPPAVLEPACPTVTPVPPPAGLGLDPFYTRYVDMGGVPLVGSSAVPDAAFAVAYYVFASMTRDRPCLRWGLMSAEIRVGIIASSEVTTDMPEYSDFYEAFPGTDWDTRGRGFGATLVRPLVSDSEENLLRDPSDRWFGENILLHELAHTLFEFGRVSLAGGAEAQAELNALYTAAMAQGLWANTYAASNPAEDWAEGVQDCYGNNLEADPPNGIHNHVNTREELWAYDPGLAAFIQTQLGDATFTAWCDPTGAGPAWTDPTPADPWAAACEERLHYAELSDCATVATLSAGPPGASAPVRFVHRGFSGVLQLFRLDGAGVRQVAGTLPPRSERTLSAHTAEPFVLADEAGQCLGVLPAPTPDETRLLVQ